MSRLAVMGSGETAPTMMRIHRELFEATPDGPAVMLDTPFAFQMNRAELVARTRLYFAESVGREVQVVAWPPTEDDPVAVERSLALLDSATWVFAGPGSPTYALDRWRATPVPAALTAVLRRGGTVVLGSAAAVTAGTHAIPVYEIYKVGQEPGWVEGLDLLGSATGISAAVVPHYDNREGGTHDTRFCYLGEPRLVMLEAQLPAEVGVLGVDEHTALLLDLDAGTASVLGSGVVSVRRRGSTTTVPSGAELPLADLAALVRGDRDSAAEPPAGTDVVREPRVIGEPTPVGAATSLHEAADLARADFDAALRRRDASGCVTAVLRLEAAIADWSADTLQSSDRADARRVLRALVARLGELAVEGVRDPSELIGPFVELLVTVRDRARAERDFALSDAVRDGLDALGIELRDAVEATTWSRRQT